MARFLEDNPAYDISIVGATDPRALGSYDNQALSERRAHAVKSYLTSNATVNTQRIQVAWCGGDS